MQELPFYSSTQMHVPLLLLNSLPGLVEMARLLLRSLAFCLLCRPLGEDRSGVLWAFGPPAEVVQERK